MRRKEVSFIGRNGRSISGFRRVLWSALMPIRWVCSLMLSTVLKWVVSQRGLFGDMYYGLYGCVG